MINELSLERLVEQLWPSTVAAEAPGREVLLRVQSDLPPLYGDPSMISQLVGNLLSNAVKYSRHRSPAIVEIGGGRLPNRPATVFFVRDNGMGFDMRFEKRIFDLFARLVTDAAYEGTGVGLAIARRVVERHRGSIWVESRPGEGTTFFFELPDPAERKEGKND
jgi:signal transduction histidine kinase